MYSLRSFFRKSLQLFCTFLAGLARSCAQVFFWRELLRITMFALKRSRAGMDAEHEPRPRAGKRSGTIFGEGAATIALFGGRASSPKMVPGATAAREPRGSEKLRRCTTALAKRQPCIAATSSDHAERGRRPKGRSDFGWPSVADKAARSTTTDLPRP